jgi:flagellar motor switch protein FliM
MKDKEQTIGLEELEGLVGAQSRQERRGRAPDGRQQVHAYNFRSPHKFSRQQLRAVQVVHEGWARNLATVLSGNLGEPVQVTLAAVEQVSYRGFIEELGPALFYIISLSPLAGLALLVLGGPLAYPLADRLLGGAGAPSGARAAPTEVETVVLRRLVERVLSAWRQEWAQVMEITPHVEGMETDPQFLLIAQPAETVVRITLEVAWGEAVGHLHLVITCDSAERAVQRLCTRDWLHPVEPASTPLTRRQLSQQLSAVLLEVIACLGSARLTLRDLLQLEEGDILRLDTRADGEITLGIGEQPKFRCRPGLLGKRLGVQVTGVMEEEGGE